MKLEDFVGLEGGRAIHTAMFGSGHARQPTVTCQRCQVTEFDGFGNRPATTARSTPTRRGMPPVLGVLVRVGPSDWLGGIYLRNGSELTRVALLSGGGEALPPRAVALLARLLQLAREMRMEHARRRAGVELDFDRLLAEELSDRDFEPTREPHDEVGGDPVTAVLRLKT